VLREIIEDALTAGVRELPNSPTLRDRFDSRRFGIIKSLELNRALINFPRESRACEPLDVSLYIRFSMYDNAHMYAPGENCASAKWPLFPREGRGVCVQLRD